MLTARTAQEDRITGLNEGADDYLPKPFGAGELLARIRAVLRRIEKSAIAEPRTISMGGVELNPQTRTVSVHGERMDVTAIEFDILEFLMRSTGRTVSRDELTAMLYHRESTPYERSLDVHVSHLRKKLEAAGPLIHTVRRAGYMFAPAPAQADGEPHEVGVSQNPRLVFRSAAAVSGRVHYGDQIRVRRGRARKFYYGCPCAADRGGRRSLRRPAASAGLAAYLKRLHRFMREHDYVTDAQGKDLATGEDRSALLRLARPISEPPRQSQGRLVFVTTSGDGKIRLISAIDPPIGVGNLLPYYFLILAAVALVCWLLAVNIASPLRDLARAVERFGRGDLSVRLKSRRKDEIGELSRSFDRMAERIGTLMTSERRLLQDVSHELRSPLARLSLAAELVRTAPDRDAAVDRMTKEIDRLADLVGTLVEVARAEGDPSAARLEPLRLGALLQEVVADCRVYADSRGCGINMTDDVDVTLRANRELLRRAVENVVRNAIRYTPQGATVDVRTESAGESVRISVRDSGPGVPEELLPKIFQPFFRVDDSRDSSTGGVGLGLAIAYRAVSVHHGRLWAQNVNPGLNVWIELPVAA